MKKLRILWAVLIGLSLIFSACTPPQPTPGATPTLDVRLVSTAVNQTQTAIAIMTGLAPTQTPAATDISTTALPPTLPPPTATLPPPTNTPVPLQMSTKGDKAAFVRDVLVADGTRLEPGMRFTKIWRIMNNGDSIWTGDYSLVYVSGTRFGDTVSVPIPNEVAPGKTIDLSVRLVAPQETGNFRSYWMLRNSEGEYFGIGPQGNEAIWVDIIVGPGLGTPGKILTQVLLTEDAPRGSRGKCPRTLYFTITFTVTQPTKIVYKWEGGSETPGINISDFDPIEMELTEAGTFVSEPSEFRFDGNVSGWFRIHVLEPEDILSNIYAFDVRCD